jgi:hypothetical protein
MIGASLSFMLFAITGNEFSELLAAPDFPPPPPQADIVIATTINNNFCMLKKYH